jgi:hypothetical protein
MGLETFQWFPGYEPLLARLNSVKCTFLDEHENPQMGRFQFFCRFRGGNSFPHIDLCHTAPPWSVFQHATHAKPDDSDNQSFIPATRQFDEIDGSLYHLPRIEA